MVKPLRLILICNTPTGFPTADQQGFFQVFWEKGPCQNWEIFIGKIGKLGKKLIGKTRKLGILPHQKPYNISLNNIVKAPRTLYFIEITLYFIEIEY